MSENLGSVFSFSEDLSTAEAPLPLPAGVYSAVVKSAEAAVEAYEAWVDSHDNAERRAEAETREWVEQQKEARSYL